MDSTSAPVIPNISLETNNTGTTMKDPTSPDDGMGHSGENEMADKEVEQTAAGISMELVELTNDNAFEVLGYSFPSSKKWWILHAIFLVQTSMNFNASIYGNAINGMSEEFGKSTQEVRYGQVIFLIAYAFGCELWAPWSEENGRHIVLQLSMLFVNLFQIPCALANDFRWVMAFRFLGGLSLAGGSVTLGVVADMYEQEAQQFAVGWVVLSSVGGSVVGPIVGSILETYLNWRSIFWAQLIFGLAVQICHFFVPETRSTKMLDKEAKRRRKAGQLQFRGPSEMKPQKMTIKKVLEIWYRPFSLLFTEPIVLCLSALSGFSDALIFSFLESYGLVFSQWKFSVLKIGLAFAPLGIGYIVAYLAYLPDFMRQRAWLRRNHTCMPPERRLKLLLWLAPLEFIGLFGFAWTSSGPPMHWAVPMFFSFLIAIANFAIYLATVDYMIAAYGVYAASATGGNGFARDLLAGLAGLYTGPLYRVFPKPRNIQWASTLLGGISLLITIPIYIFYWFGPAIRKRSKFAESMVDEQKHTNERRRARKGVASGTTTPVPQAGLSQRASLEVPTGNNATSTGCELLQVPPQPYNSHGIERSNPV